MLKKLATSLVVPGLIVTFGQAAGMTLSEIGVWDRPAPHTQCSLSEDSNQISIQLPFDKGEPILIEAQHITATEFQGVSNDGVLVTYTKAANGNESCEGKRHMPALGGALQWATLNYQYAIPGKS